MAGHEQKANANPTPCRPNAFGDGKRGDEHPPLGHNYRLPRNNAQSAISSVFVHHGPLSPARPNTSAVEESGVRAPRGRFQRRTSDSNGPSPTFVQREDKDEARALRGL